MCLWCKATHNCLKLNLWVLRQKGVGNKPTVSRKHLLIAAWALFSSSVSLLADFSLGPGANRQSEILMWCDEEVNHKNNNIPTGVMSNLNVRSLLSLGRVLGWDPISVLCSVHLYVKLRQVRLTAQLDYRYLIPFLPVHKCSGGSNSLTKFCQTVSHSLRFFITCQKNVSCKPAMC